MEDVEVGTTGMEAGEASPSDSPAGDRVDSEPDPITIEMYFERILEEQQRHKFAIQGLSSALMELAGRLNFIEEALFDVPLKEEPKSE